PDEITLVEATKEFRALNPGEKSIPLPAHHYEQIQAALKAFAEAIIAETLQPQTVGSPQGPNERRALAFLDAFLSFPFLSEGERRIISEAKSCIRRARFQNLQRQINELQRSQKKERVTPAILLGKLLEILKAYPLEHPAAEIPLSASPLP